MILTDREIQLMLSNGQIIITPSPADDAFSSTTVDLTLDSQISEFNNDPEPGMETILDPGVELSRRKESLKRLPPQNRLAMMDIF